MSFLKEIDEGNIFTLSSEENVSDEELKLSISSLKSFPYSKDFASPLLFEIVRDGVLSFLKGAFTWKPCL